MNFLIVSGFLSWPLWRIRLRCPTRSPQCSTTPKQPGKSVAESVATALEGRVRLLVFDNCEHLRDAVADLVEAILARSGSFKILPTSREGLRVADEQL